jgi:hypothetical protein
MPIIESLSEIRPGFGRRGKTMVACFDRILTCALHKSAPDRLLSAQFFPRNQKKYNIFQWYRLGIGFASLFLKSGVYADRKGAAL